VSDFGNGHDVRIALPLRAQRLGERPAETPGPEVGTVLAARPFDLELGIAYSLMVKELISTRTG
jgi:hypothetical protein